MLVVDLKVGDVVKKFGDEHLYVITALNPIQGISQYVTIMGPYGRFENVWVNLLEKVVDTINLDSIFEKLQGVDSEAGVKEEKKD